MSPTSYQAAPPRALDTTRLATLLQPHPDIGATSWQIDPHWLVNRQQRATKTEHVA